MKELFPRITVDQTTQFGKPVIVGTRVPVEVVVGHIAVGETIETVMQEYRLTKEQVLAALQYAAKLVAQETVMVR
ncbi:MAG TPA: DUF433 domain-containing protein [Candidatus Paceibacterota bacterium]|nr:DUF433 domain-containing protein [Candidatus Paceibacterota bacterium]